MIPTPSTSHVDYDRVYEPAEDSYLLLDTLSSNSESTFLRTLFPPSYPSPLALEVGTGSGVVLAFLTAYAKHIVGRSDVATLGTDVNRFACEATMRTVEQTAREAAPGPQKPACLLGCVEGDLATAVRARSVDILIFNPPYVPTEVLPIIPGSSSMATHTHTERFERDSQLLSLSYAGGVDGMETTDRLLEQLPEVLSQRGVAYVLLCAQNRPKDVASRVHSWPGGWSAEVVGSSGNTAGWERLCVLRIWKPT